MKKALLILFFLAFLISNTMAQTGINFGFKAGYNLATQYGTLPADNTFEVSSDARNGFSGGIFLFFPITEAFGVQQEFLYSQKGSRQQVIQPGIKISSEYNIDYFELPILFRYNFINIGKVRVYGSSGFGLSMLLKGEYAVDLVVETPGGPLALPPESGDTDGLDGFDYSFIYGLGVKFELFDQNCFFDYRQTIGWNTLMMPTGAGGDPAPLRNQTYSFSLGIYF